MVLCVSRKTRFNDSVLFIRPIIFTNVLICLLFCSSFCFIQNSVVMPVRKKPDTLFNLSVNELVTWFKNSWKCSKECVPVRIDMLIPSTEITNFSRNVATLKLHIPTLFDEIPVDIFSEVVPKLAVAFFRSHTSGQFCLICLRKRLTILLTKRLKRWDMMKFLDCDWFEEPLLSEIKSVFLWQIPSMKNIVHLCLRRVCDDSILRCIGENCHLIEYLDIEYSEVTDEGLMYLIPSENSAGCPKLEELILGDNKYRITITSHTVALLLKSLPDIVYIDYYNMRPALLEMFDTDESQKSAALKLKRLQLDIDINAELSVDREIIMLSKLCPNLEELVTNFQIEIDVLPLIHFALLSQLHIKYFYGEIFPVAEAKQYFSEHCKQLTNLEVSCDIFDTTCFSLLGKHCPSLAKLSIECTVLGASGPFNRNEENNLKILSIFMLTCESYLEDELRLVMCDLLCSILKSTNRLTVVSLDFPIQYLSHQDLQFLLDVVDVHLLHSLRIMNSYGDPCFNLTMESVYLILEKCPLMKSLGYLGHWDVVYSDVEKLRKDLEYSNYDIKIH